MALQAQSVPSVHEFASHGAAMLSNKLAPYPFPLSIMRSFVGPLAVDCQSAAVVSVIALLAQTFESSSANFQSPPAALQYELVP